MEIKEKVVGVIGGMGPEATLDLFYKIIKNTPVERDQDHIHLIIDNYPQIPDRTSFILGKGENPLPYILKSAKLLENIGVDVICMPCNTSHFFEEDIKREIKVPFISIIKCVIEELKNVYKKYKNVGLLATKGTIITKIYENPIKKEGFNFIKPSDEIQKDLMDIIYSIKSGKLTQNIDKFKKVIDNYISLDAEILITGCTEISLILPHVETKIPIIDSNLSLAKSVIKFVKGINI